MIQFFHQTWNKIALAYVYMCFLLFLVVWYKKNDQIYIPLLYLLIQYLPNSLYLQIQLKGKANILKPFDPYLDWKYWQAWSFIKNTWKTKSVFKRINQLFSEWKHFMTGIFLYIILWYWITKFRRFRKEQQITKTQASQFNLH